MWLRLLSGAGEEGLIRASGPHLCTHRLSKNVCHHHVRRGCPPRRCPRQRRPPVRATRERRARRRGSIPPARLASGLGSQRARRVFAATGARRARADRDRKRARARADAPASVVKRYTFRPSPTPARVSRLARSKRAVHRSSAALDPIHRGRLSASSACETRGTRAARVRSSPRLADRPTPSSLAPQLYPRGRPRRQEPLRPCVRTTPRAAPPVQSDPYRLSRFGQWRDEPLGSLAFSRRDAWFPRND